MIKIEANSLEDLRNEFQRELIFLGRVGKKEQERCCWCGRAITGGFINWNDMKMHKICQAFVEEMHKRSGMEEWEPKS